MTRLTDDIVRRVDPVDEDQELREFLRDLERELVIPVTERKEVARVVTLDTVTKRDLPVRTKAGTMAVPAPKVQAPAGVGQSAELLLNSNARAVLVYADGEYSGIVTEKSLLHSPELATIDLPIERIMNEPVTLSQTATVGDARALMRRHGFGRLPVVDGRKRLVGLVDRSTMLVLERPKKAHRRHGDRSSEATRDNDLELGTVMETQPLRVEPGTPVSEVARLMTERETTSALVLRDGQLEGIVTTVDILELLVARPPREGVYIQITGQQALDAFERERLHAVLDGEARKVASIYEGTEYLYVHVKRHDREGQRSRWRVRTRLFTRAGMFYSRAAGYDLPVVADDAMEKLDRVVRRSHSKATSHRRIHAVPRPAAKRGRRKSPTEEPFRARRTP